ncbi:MAG: hypothetical protein WBD46_16155, partial [Acidobacteriaceae bacterium]
GKVARVSPSGNSNPSPARRRRTAWRVFAWAGSIAAILVIAALITGDILLHHAGPLLKEKVEETLSTRFDSRVELATFQVSVFRGFEVYGTGLKLYPNHLQIDGPMIAVDRFSFHVLNWRQLFKTPMYINRVLVSGLSIHMPPKDQRSNMPHMEKPGGGQGNGIKILVGEIQVDHADLVIENGKPGKVPLDFVIDKLDLHSVGAGRPMRFHAILVNPKPIGDIDSTGDFGPFDAHSPGDTPVDGNYAFRNADLGTIKGIGGILASNGHYQGQLNHIEVDGETTTPDFSLDIANRPVPLNTHFHAIVDGTNGDTYLQPVDAWLEKTHIVAQGKVVRVQGVPGRDIRLDVTVGPGHIQDILLLAVRNQPPLMNGDVQLHTKFNLPPGPASVTDRLQLQGNFSLLNTVFTSDNIQSKVDELSLRGQGKPKQAKQAGAIEAASAQPGAAGITSEMRGTFTFGSHKLTLSALNYRVPGADIALAGNYNLDNQTLDFTGTARLDAHVSQMVTGWKSWLLKPVDPFFAKDGAGTQVPIKVGGTTSHPDIGLDFHH